jgi:hypothetical protein
VAAAREAGLLCRSDLTEAYDRLRVWGISNFSNRWRRLVETGPADTPAAPPTPVPGGRGITTIRVTPEG